MSGEDSKKIILHKIDGQNLESNESVAISKIIKNEIVLNGNDCRIQLV